MQGDEKRLTGLMKSKLKIVHVLSNAPFAYPLPPLNQGGTEKVFYDLTEELVHQGHEVHVFAPSGSTCSANVIEFPPDLAEEHIGEFVAGNLPDGIDIINDFTFTSSVKQLQLPIPTVSTHQCPLGVSDDLSVYPSREMMSAAGEGRGHVIYNGIHPDEYEYNAQKQDYLFFIGRLVREKGILEAIQVALRTNHRLIIAGPIKDEQLFREEIEPVLGSNANIEYVGPVGGERKQELFKNAKCLLFPISWEEPFGLVMVEAMMTGTPVLAFNRGSVPEVMAGYPQLICNDIEEMIQKVAISAFPSPIELRKYATNHFSRQKMADSYLKLYRGIIGVPPIASMPARVRIPKPRHRRPLRRKRLSKRKVGLKKKTSLKKRSDKLSPRTTSRLGTRRKRIARRRVKRRYHGRK